MNHREACNTRSANPIVEGHREEQYDAYDRLPPLIREALQDVNVDIDATQIGRLFDQAIGGSAPTLPRVVIEVKFVEALYQNDEIELHGWHRVAGSAHLRAGVTFIRYSSRHAARTLTGQRLRHKRAFDRLTEDCR